MQLGEIYKYLPTSTVGKILDMRERDGRSWALLDYTGLWYDAAELTPADPSEYHEVHFKERKSSFEKGLQSVEDMAQETKDVDITGFTPSGGG
jgi:hypothetical protein